MWFANFWTNSVGRVTPIGRVHRLRRAATASPAPWRPVADGAMWFTSWRHDYIGRIGQDRPGADLPPSPPSSRCATSCPARRGDVVRDGRPSARSATSAAPGRSRRSPTVVASQSLVAGADGNVWLAPGHGHRPSHPDRDAHDRSATPSSVLRRMTLGPDGNVWFTDGRTSGSGSSPRPGPSRPSPGRAVRSPDLAVWTRRQHLVHDRRGAGGQAHHRRRAGRTRSPDPSMDEPTAHRRRPARRAVVHRCPWPARSARSAPSRANPVRRPPPSTASVPQRILDSRLADVGFAGPVVAGSPRTLQVERARRRRRRVPWGASAVVLNVTVVDPTANSFVTV